MREMLTQASFESFRVSTLDLMSRLRELVLLIKEAEAAHLPIAAIEPVLQEVASSLIQDPIAKKALSAEVETFCDYVKKTDVKRLDPYYVTGFCTLFQKRIGSDYVKSIEDEILSCYSDSSRRDELRASCSSYCAHLVNTGYNKTHLLDLINNRFFNEDIGKVETRTLQRFFSTLTKEDKKYRVWVSAPATTANFIVKSGLPNIEVIQFRNVPADVRSAYAGRPSHSPKHRYLSTCVDAKDPQSAATQIFQTLSSIESFVILGRQSVELNWDRAAYVRTPRSERGSFIESKPFALLGTPKTAQGFAAGSIRSQARRALSDFDQPSTERLLSAVNTAALAKASPNLENHLISLWSAIEVLLSNPPAGVPRIVHYVDLLAPCICSRYVRRYFVAVYDAISASYRQPFSTLINGMAIDSNMDSYTRFTHICLDPAYKSEQAEMLKMLSNNPLALHRLWKLEKNFGAPKAYTASINDHERRVRWQLHRIYRTRNQLVHNGSVPVYLEPLVLNMLEYFRSTIGPIIGRGSKESERANIDQLVTEAGIDFGVTKRRLSAIKGAAFAVEDYPRFFR